MDVLQHQNLTDHDLILIVAKGQEDMAKDIKEMKDGTAATLARLESGKVDKEEYNRHLLEDKDSKRARELALQSFEARIKTIEEWKSRVVGALIILNVILGIALSISIAFIKRG